MGKTTTTKTTKTSRMSVPNAQKKYPKGFEILDDLPSEDDHPIAGDAEDAGDVEEEDVLEEEEDTRNARDTKKENTKGKTTYHKYYKEGSSESKCFLIKNVEKHSKNHEALRRMGAKWFASMGAWLIQRTKFELDEMTNTTMGKDIHGQHKEETNDEYHEIPCILVSGGSTRKNTEKLKSLGARFVKTEIDGKSYLGWLIPKKKRGLFEAYLE